MSYSGTFRPYQMLSYYDKLIGSTDTYEYEGITKHHLLTMIKYIGYVSVNIVHVWAMIGRVVLTRLL